MDIQKIQQYSTQSLMQDLRHIIEQARGHVAATANYELTMMYWHIAERINREVLDNQRAEYGKQIVATVSRQLQENYNIKGFDEKSIRRMMQFAALFTDEQIVAQLARKLFWSLEIANPNFKGVEFDHFRMQAGLPNFTQHQCCAHQRWCATRRTTR